MAQDKQRVAEALELVRLLQEIESADDRRRLIEIAREMAKSKKVQPH